MFSRFFLIAALVALLAVVAAGQAGAAGQAEAFDRTPVYLTGLSPDGWGQSISRAEAGLRYRYPGISRVECVGVLMAGHLADSFWADGLTRYWDKLSATGYTTSGRAFTLIYDGKARYTWIIYRLRGAALNELRVAL